jgi:hypothetical protein
VPPLKFCGCTKTPILDKGKRSTIFNPSYWMLKMFETQLHNGGLKRDVGREHLLLDGPQKQKELAVLTVVTTWGTIFWDMILCSPMEVRYSSGGTGYPFSVNICSF